MFSDVASAVRIDWDKTCSVTGYAKRRLSEVSTWSAISASFVAANALSEPWSAMTVIIAIIIILLPSKAIAAAVVDPTA